MPTLLPHRRTPLPLIAGLLTVVLAVSAYGLLLAAQPHRAAGKTFPGPCPRAGTAPMPVACVPEPPNK
ncbi:hypothetical protein [Deinococcus hopiensis]|uniref:Uncharacterized protein n=1 Tax=Deinococcus hopiensis KR-140 TaxID=695939 RepID=A0A1W1VFP1_9DEIO|nr:hypothetical protein [Deinococcus hopiensis]SMB92126.1 hypothetical protein SAMN00790413_01451 [Deinococcus hopiensis KR-140]